MVDDELINKESLKYMENEYQTLETDPGTETNVDAAESTQNDEVAQTAAPALSLEEINALTRRNYQSVEDARKGITNLVSTVGKKEVVKEVVKDNPQLERKVQELEFYLEHPELKPHKELLSRFGNPNEAIKDPVVQKVLKAVEASADKETLQTNSRITHVQSGDLVKDVESLKNTGDYVGLLKKHYGIDIEGR